MATLSREENAEIFSAAEGVAADQLNISPLAVEEDYWVCEALREITQFAPDKVVFKSGTSLEKLRIIQRFSEDLDLLIIGAEAKAKMLMKDLCRAAAAATNRTLSDEMSRGNTGWYWRQSYFETPQIDQGDVPGLADSGRILLELGETGGPNPHGVHPIESLLARALVDSW